MAKYLAKGNYVGKGIAGLVKEGGSSRAQAIEELVKSVGGSVDSIYYSFGATDIYVIVDLPDNAGAAALSLAINGSGAATEEMVVLMTPKEMDRVTNVSPSYRPPGG